MENTQNGKDPGHPPANGDAAGAAAEEEAPKKTGARRVGAKPPIEREPYSLYCLGLKNPVRKKLIEIVEWKSFEAFILIAICGTCLCLAVFQPMPNGDSTAINEFLVRTDYNRSGMKIKCLLRLSCRKK